jgi:hypothetical protein
MTTVELLEQALALARRSGYKVRQEWLDGCLGGACFIKGQKWLFLDPTQSPGERLEAVLNALWADSEVCAVDVTALLEQEAAEKQQKAPQRKAA